MVATSLGLEPRQKTFTWFVPPIVMWANLPLLFFTKFTWLVIGPVSRSANCQPELHQLNFGFLVGNDFLREPAHLRVAAMEKFRSCHVNGGLMMRQHQVHEINIVVARWFHGTHG